MYKAILLILASIYCFTVSAIVWNPQITEPSSATVWKAGDNVNVKWDTTIQGEKIPDGVDGIIKLGYLEDGSINEHLYWTLAGNFPLNRGYQNVTLPSDLETKDSYIIVLMGDSGNASPKFTIQSA
ncbi:hypothetical protein BCR43DRAFT_513470 [Syncephalastrum racemosum]|uniref:Ser-Thr-rich glycosyl-phosphatidyl-inositol-anchored membrane family-domain-containing protein n=1 Tax=Syncephalastrum racemosum TaxID=13706 RepID=A0A1X2HK21_SYNRA|nr:hypothetical protein BCR43DRAFT_513470 [Syncephalastrum racemosum]